MDPNSSVREGEYRNVQEYSQSLVDKLGIKMGRVFDNGGLLTPEARKMLKDTVKDKAFAIQKQFSAYRGDVRKRLEGIAPGQADNLLGEHSQDIFPPTMEVDGATYVLDQKTGKYKRVGNAATAGRN
jgi:hypothetical protein